MVVALNLTTKHIDDEDHNDPLIIKRKKKLTIFQREERKRKLCDRRWLRVPAHGLPQPGEQPVVLRLEQVRSAWPGGHQVQGPGRQGPSTQGN